jgi:hypothetical protein
LATFKLFFFKLIAVAAAAANVLACWILPFIILDVYVAKLGSTAGKFNLKKKERNSW